MIIFEYIKTLREQADWLEKINKELPDLRLVNNHFVADLSEYKGKISAKLQQTNGDEVHLRVIIEGPIPILHRRWHIEIGKDVGEGLILHNSWKEIISKAGFPQLVEDLEKQLKENGVKI